MFSVTTGEQITPSVSHRRISVSSRRGTCKSPAIEASNGGLQDLSTMLVDPLRQVAVAIGWPASATPYPLAAAEQDRRSSRERPRLASPKASQAVRTPALARLLKPSGEIAVMRAAKEPLL